MVPSSYCLVLVNYCCRGKGAKKQPFAGLLLKKCSLKFHKIYRKNLHWSLFFNKIAGLETATLLKVRMWYRCFPRNFIKFLKSYFFTEHLRTTSSGNSRVEVFCKKGKKTLVWEFLFLMKLQVLDLQPYLKKALKEKTSANRSF